MDLKTQVHLRLPAGWNLAHKDGELSTFHLDARSAPKNASLRAVAALNFNPLPRSTFSGALFYLSATPHASASSCAAQTQRKPEKSLAPVTINDIKFTRGRHEQGPHLH